MRAAPRGRARPLHAADARRRAAQLYHLRVGANDTDKSPVDLILREVRGEPRPPLPPVLNGHVSSVLPY